MKEQLSNFLIQEYDRILFESYELSEQEELEIIQELLSEGVDLELNESIDDEISKALASKQKNPNRDPGIAKLNKKADNRLFYLRKKKKALASKEDGTDVRPELTATTDHNDKKHDVVNDKPTGSTGTTGPSKENGITGTTGPTKEGEPSEKDAKKIESMKSTVKSMVEKYENLQKSNSSSIKAQIDFLDAMVENENPYLTAYITAKKLKYKVKFLQELSKAHISHESLSEIAAQLKEEKDKLGDAEEKQSKINKKGKTANKPEDINAINKQAGNDENGEPIEKTKGDPVKKPEETPEEKTKGEESEKATKEKEAKEKEAKEKEDRQKEAEDYERTSFDDLKSKEELQAAKKNIEDKYELVKNRFNELQNTKHRTPEEESLWKKLMVSKSTMVGAKREIDDKLKAINDNFNTELYNETKLDIWAFSALIENVNMQLDDLTIYD